MLCGGGGMPECARAPHSACASPRAGGARGEAGALRQSHAACAGRGRARRGEGRLGSGRCSPGGAAAAMAAREGGPVGLALLRDVFGMHLTTEACKALTLLVTFLAYASFHMSRKAPSVVKSVLCPSKGNSNALARRSHRLLRVNQGGWAPFNGKDGKTELGNLDMAFLLTYAVGMFFTGHIADHMNLRHFLVIGLVMSGLFTALYGAAFFWDVHDVYYFLFVQVFGGLFQSMGWPAVVAVVGNWFAKGKRGLIMGIWNSHTSVGNILGATVPAAVLHFGWGWCMVVPGAVMGAIAIIVGLFLVVDPTEVGLPSPYKKESEAGSSQIGGDNETGLPRASGDAVSAVTERTASSSSLASSGSGGAGRKADSVSFVRALSIPGVATFACSLFFAKLVAYTFLYWLPFYVNNTVIGGKSIGPTEAANLSTLFDVAGILGGVVAGYLSDRTRASGTIATGFLMLAVPALYMYQARGHVNLITNIILMMLSGFFVNGPYALITTAVSAELGTHESLKGNAKALATVTAIIDGTGSLGAAVGPPLTGLISSSYGWSKVFFMLYVAAGCAALMLCPVVSAEYRRSRKKRERNRDSQPEESEDAPLLE